MMTAIPPESREPLADAVAEDHNRATKFLGTNERKRSWRCDVCQQRFFPTWEEAAEHEALCRTFAVVVGQTSDNVTQEERAQGTTDTRCCINNHDDVEDKNDANVIANNETEQTARSPRESLSLENRNITKNQSSAATTMTTTTTNATTAKPIHPFFQITSKPPQSVSSSSNANGSNLCRAKVTSQKDATSSQSKIKKRKTQSCRQDRPRKKVDNQVTASTNKCSTDATLSNSATSSQEISKLAAMFGIDTQTFLAQQRALELQAQCRRTRQRDQHQKGIANAQLLAKDLVDQTSEETATIHTASPQTKRFAVKGGALRFPNPSHIIPRQSSPTELELDYSRGPSDWLSREQIQESKLNQCGARMSHDTAIKTVTKIQLLSSPVNAHDQEFECGFPLVIHRHLHELFAQAFHVIVPAPEVSSMSSQIDIDMFRIHKLPFDIGPTRWKLCQSIIEWVNEWKSVRQRCLDYMYAKQQARLRQQSNKPTRKTTYKNDNDDLWEDSDQEESALPAICLLTGPVGCGKSDLVHAVAKHCHTNLIELSTADKRSAASLRTAIGEATQSLANFSEQSKPSSTALLEGHFFKMKEASKTEIKTVTGELTSLTAVLIDEVDNLYEQDSGFWPGLLELSKLSKCPIFLTANSFPSPLRTTNVLHICIPKPTADECANRIIARIEKMPGRFELKEGAMLHLRQAASLCRCDLRKLAHELHSFVPAVHACKLQEPPQYLLATGEDAKPSIQLHSVQPHSVQSGAQSLVTITGANFLQWGTNLDALGYRVQVSMGGQMSPQARIIDDKTILAVCPPYHIGTNAIAYCPIRVAQWERLGPLSDTSSALNRITLADGTGWLTVAKPICLEIHSSPEKGNNDAEFEVHDKECLPTVPRIAPVDMAMAVSLLKDGVKAWRSRHHCFPKPPRNTYPATGGVSEVECLEWTCSWMSDAALIRDTNDCLPYLSGSVAGFGYDCTESFPRCTNENSKRPSEDELFTLGWKDVFFFYGCSNTYMTLPKTRRDRNLLVMNATLPHEQDVSVINNSSIDEGNDDPGPFESENFLPNPRPSYLSLFPFLRSSCDVYEPPKDYYTFQRKNEPVYAWELLSNYIFDTDAYKCRAKVLGIPPMMVPTQKVMDLDRRVWLDYIPLIRCMAVMDRAEAQRWSQSSSQDELATHNQGRRHRTRGRVARGYEYHLTKQSQMLRQQERHVLVKDECDNDDDDDENQHHTPLGEKMVVSALADLALRF